MRKRSIAIEGHRTSIALEAPFWDALQSAADRDGRSLAALVAEIDRRRLLQTPQPGLASALRVFALSAVRNER
jgi:predicted DNA-binding ribbon-helix-helix protein